MSALLFPPANAALHLLAHLLTTLIRVCRPGGTRSLFAENLLLKQQLLMLAGARQRAPNLRPCERILFGAFSAFLQPRRSRRAAIIVRPSTLLRLHQALVRFQSQELSHGATRP